jgi:hypothetical protein
MHRKQIAFSSALATFVCFGLFAVAAFGQPADRAAEQEIESALLQKDTFDLTDFPLNAFIADLREKYGLNLVIDYRAIREKGIDAQSPISLKLRNVSVRSALELAIRPLGLNWTVYSEAIVVSTPAGIQEMQFTKVYDLTDLTSFSDSEGKTWDEPDALVDLITSNIAPETWDGMGGRGTIQLVSAGAAKVLVVTQDYRVQRHVDRLLAELQAAVKLHSPPKGPRGRDSGMGGDGPQLPPPR